MDLALRLTRRLCLPALACAALAGAPAASADLPSLLGSCQSKDALDDDSAASELPFFFCDDGVPGFGGTTPNVGAVKAVAVPAAYTGQGQPDKDAVAALAIPGNSAGDIALDVDLSLPDPDRHPVPASGYPLIVLMHGCCAGNKTSWEGKTIDPGGKENWHYNNAWFASRGYAVLTYTSRGFVDGSEHGSTGETQLDSDRFEINDYQHLAGQLADFGDLNPATAAIEKIDPQRVVPTGGSYGGGFAWMALTDPTWQSPDGQDMKVVAVATKYGWTNLVEALVPNGADLRDSLPSPDPAGAANPLGFPKRTIVAGLYASGKTGVPPGSSHTTFPSYIDEAITCLESADPYELNPLCATTLESTLPSFINDRSAYYENGFFDGLASGDVAPVPVYSAGTFTDQLFPAPEHRRMVERLKATVPGYPVQEHYGDYNHFVQNKRKEWADICGEDRHVCDYADYPAADGAPSRDLNAGPTNPAREPGVTSRLNRFIDHYAKPGANPGEPTPAFDVTAALQVCPQNGPSLGIALDEPGPRFTAPSFDALAPGRLTFAATGSQTTTHFAGANPHAKNADPVSNSAANGGACPVESSPGGAATAGPGVATYDSDVLGANYTMLGATRIQVTHTGAGSSLQLNARMYDLYPDGTQVLVDRGVKRLTDGMGPTTLDLHGNGWRFDAGHRVRIELAQDDDPYVKSSVAPGSLMIEGVDVSIPVREEGTTVVGGARPPRVKVVTPRLASDRSRSRRFKIRIRLRPGTARSNVGGYELQIRDKRAKSSSAASTPQARKSASQARVFRFRGKAGHTYRIRARAVDNSGRPGPWDSAETIVPLDDSRKATKRLRYRGGWARKKSKRAYARGLTRSTKAGARLNFSFRGDRLFIVGRTSSRGGKALVKLNGHRRVISFYSKRVRNRKVVAIMRTRRRRANRVRIVNLHRKGAKRGRGTRVEIDALGIRYR